jgi:hypothetical protein
MRTYARANYAGLLLASSLLLAGCAQDPINLVKTGTLTADSSVAVGGALDGYRYFKTTKWETLETEQGRKVVQFTGTIKLEALVGYTDKETLRTITPAMVEKALSPDKGFELEYIAQFTILKSSDHPFELYYSGCKMRLAAVKDKATGGPAEEKIKDEDGSFLMAIFANQPPPAIFLVFTTFELLQPAQ